VYTYKNIESEWVSSSVDSGCFLHLVGGVECMEFYLHTLHPFVFWCLGSEGNITIFHFLYVWIS
jgi:hypothetical protein